MTEYRDVLERELERLSPPRIPIDRLARRRDRKHRNQRIGATVVGIVVSLVAIGGLIRALGEGERIGRPAPSPTVETTREPADLSLVDVSSGRARPLPESISTLWEAGSFEVSPDGESLAFDARVDPKGFHQVFVGNVDGSNVRQVTTDDSVQARNPSWSPDGTRIVYEGRIHLSLGQIKDDLFVLDLARGVTRGLSLELAPIPQFDVHTPSFGPDGLTIVYTDFDPDRDSVDLRYVGVDGGRTTLLIRRAAFGSLSPDRQTIAYRRALSIPGLADGISFRTLDHTTPPAGPEGGIVMGPLLEFEDSAIPSWSPSGRWVAYLDPAPANLEPRRVHLFDLEMGRVTVLGRGTEAAWLDDDTLIVREYQDRRG